MQAVAGIIPSSDPVELKKARRNHIKSTRNRPSEVELGWTPFRTAEKKYKARYPVPDLSDVLDFALMDESRYPEIEHGVWRGKDVQHQPEVREVRVNCGTNKKAFCLRNHPGLVILPSRLSHSQQRELVRWALRDHSKWPNETNLSTHYDIPREGLWELHCRSLQAELHDGPVIRIQPKAISDPNAPREPPGPRLLVSNTPASPDNFGELSKEPKSPAAPSSTLDPATPLELLPKLRWANIGWYYHWSTKQYDFARGKVDVSEPVRSLCTEIVKTVDWEDVYREDDADTLDWGPGGTDCRSWESTYEPDAGIVNFYQQKDTLMAHVDRSELSTTSPLVSISLGNAAIFLIGDQSRESAPTPILLRSGDAVIMSGPKCRRAYHGIPRILEGTLPAHLQPSGHDGTEDWETFGQFLRTTRININVRQVFPRGFDPYASDGKEGR